MPQIEIVVLDLDGALVDSAPAIGRILNGMRAERHLEPLDFGFYRRLISLGGEILVGRALEVSESAGGSGNSDAAMPPRRHRLKASTLESSPH